MGLTAVLRAIINAPTVAASAGRPAGVAAVSTAGSKEEEQEAKRLLRVESREKLLREREEARAAAASWDWLYALSDAVDDEVAWGYDESHAMLFDDPLEDYGWWVRWNPLYWVLIGLIVLCLLPGRWVHLPFDQGGPVRDDEMEIEKKIRLESFLSGVRAPCDADARFFVGGSTARTAPWR
jgi:hypothetical protein